MNHSIQNRPLNIPEPLPLFRDFLENREKVRPFFRWRTSGDWPPAIEQRLQHGEYRPQISEILMEQNRRWEAPAQTLQHIRLLGEQNTVAIISGQQAGLFGGPLYTVYKAMGAVHLARRLAQEFPQWHFVPIFWMEVDDHDFREVNQVNLINSSGKLIQLSLPDQPDDLRPMYLRRLPDEIEQLHARLDDECTPSEFREGIFSSLRQAYRPGATFADAFARWMLYLLGEEGLILMNPADGRLKKLAAPVYRQALENPAETRNLLNRQKEALEAAGYHAQIRVRPDQTLLFFRADDDSRCRIDVTAGGFRINHPRRPFTLSETEIKKILTAEPDRFSPNVALRPIVQDFLLPGAGYVAGPAEISYLAQIRPLYDYFRVAMPVFYPRPRITLVEKHIHRLITKFNLDVEDLFTRKEDLIPDILKRLADPSTDTFFEERQRELEQVLAQFDSYAAQIDQSLLPQVDRTRNQVKTAISRLQNRFDKVTQQKLTTETGQLNKIMLTLFPDGKPQERVLNILHFLIKYGPGFPDEISSAIKIDEFRHQLLFL